MKQTIIIILCFVLLPVVAFSQNNDFLLAMRYYNDGEFEKAAPLYYNLYRQTHATSYFNYYLQCLYQQGDYKTAEKTIKKEIKTHPNDNSFTIFLGHMYLMRQDSAKATIIFDKILKKIPDNTQDYLKVANDFIRIRALNFAEKTYRQGQKKLNGQYTFLYELGYLYLLERKWNKMVTAYLDLIKNNEDFYKSVQMRFQSALYNDDTIATILKKQLLLRIQKNPSKTIYNQLLIWVYLQENNTKKALQQAIALDKRDKKQNFNNVLRVGKLALNNNQYDLAVKAFRFIIEKASKSSNYLLAKHYYLQARFKQITSNKAINKQELETLKTSIKTIIDQYGIDDESIDIAIIYGKLLAFYLYDTESAITFFQNLLKQYLSTSNRGKLNLQLAQTLIAADKPWDAILLLAKIEKNFKNSPLGYEAKYDRARLAYFMGDFKWAQAQLDILKGSTSKLIANDAFYLSELIQDNLATDTLQLKQFAYAELLEFKNRDSLSLLTLDSITLHYPSCRLSDEILMKKADIYIKHNEYEKAAIYLKKNIETNPLEITADDACYKLARLYETKLNNIPEAKKYYKKILIDYKGSIFVNNSRKYYRALENKTSEIKQEEKKILN